MRPLVYILVAATALIFLYSALAAAEPRPTKKKQSRNRTGQVPQLRAAQKKLQLTRAMLIEKTKASRRGLKDLLETYEEKLESQSGEHTINEIMYELDLLEKPKLDESKRELINIQTAVRQMRHWIAEDDMALSLNELKDLDRSPNLPGAVIRYDGYAAWSLADAEKIASLFLRLFGRPLPVSAMGQSPTHDRMGLDHRDALDVAVRPDSGEGLLLMAYLRKAGIPFIAFRSKLRGLATGAHIHIGRPSSRLEEVNRSRVPSVTLSKASHQG
jgi:hypothetical protein